MGQYPKFENKLRQKVVNPALQENYTGGYGVILEYNNVENTAMVMMSQPGSDQMGQILTKVPCPTTMGVQGAAPEMGRMCWVQFADGTQSNPMISHYFNSNFTGVDYNRQYLAENDTPRFMMDL